MKIALVQCPGWGRDCPPYTMALLSSILRENDHKVFNFDLNNILYCSSSAEYKRFWDDKDLYYFWSDNDLINKFLEDNKRMIEFQVNKILYTDARLIGFTVHFTSLLVSLKVTKMIKKEDPSRFIVFGGPECSLKQKASMIIKKGAVDAVSVGEGDLLIQDLAKRLEAQGELDFCKGLMLRKNGQIIDCGKSDIIKNIDNLPMPDYSDFKKEISSSLYREPERLEILDSRGCLVQCHFCSEWQFWRTFRSMSGDRIYQEVIYQLKQFPGVNYFYFIGSLLNGNIKALNKFCDLVIENNLKIRWAGQAIVRPEMSKEFLDKMRRAGCVWLGYGIESGSQKIVESMNKRFSLKIAEEVLENTHRAGIQVQVNFMFGIPGENKEDFQKTLSFLEENRESIDSVLASQSFCVIDKGTYLYEHSKDFGISDRDHHLYWRSDNGEENTYPERFRRYEEFCKLALSLDLPETSGVLREKPDKWVLLGDYYMYKEDYPKAIEYFQKAQESESYKESALNKIKICKDTLKDSGKYIEVNDSGLGEDNILKYSDCGFNERQENFIQALIESNLKEKADNFVLIEQQKENREEYVLGYPYWLIIDPTNFCNLKCPFCPTGKGKNLREKSIFPLENFKRIIDELGTYLIHIDFCNWGEPFLNKDIYKMIEIAKQYNIDTKIDSNLNSLDEKDIENIILSGLDKIIVSIDGVTKETYSKYRVGGDFNKVMDNLYLLINKKLELNRTNPYICWQFLVFKHNEHEIEKVRKIGKEIGVDHVGITKAFIGDKGWIPKNQKYSHYKIDDVTTYTPDCFENQQDTACNWPWEAMVINPNGSISPCCSVEYEDDDFGNIFHEPFKNIWNNEKYRTSRSYIKDNKVIDASDNICIGCEQRGMINLDIFSCHSFFNKKANDC